MARHIASTLKALARDGLGVVVATHDLAFAAHVADRAVALRDGTAIVGTPAELISASLAGPASARDHLRDPTAHNFPAEPPA